ncbi:hypothetical protein CDAR_279701 [Caerostris darwini]|uniref:Uncharacterized protein n=1 Tax=Caerostris darwini TaxID=1538125 RepID=A0AAV4PUU0_9ARAC|nr:hypothetical protein CDAR_279701 [Caerostris darwini]
MDAGLVTAKTLKASAATVKKAEEDVIAMRTSTQIIPKRYSVCCLCVSQRCLINRSTLMMPLKELSANFTKNVGNDRGQFFQDRSSRLPPRQIITIANAQERNRHHKEQFPLLLSYYLMHCIYLFI